MNFSDFLREEQEIDLLSEAALDEGLWDVAAGLAGAAGGAFTMADEALAKMVAQGKEGRMRQGASDFTGGLRRAVFGRPQPKPERARSISDEIQAVSQEFERLKAAYKQAVQMQDRNLMRRIRARMSQVDPAAYTDLVKRSQDKRREAETRRWSRAASAPKPERPEAFLGRLSAQSKPGQAGPVQEPPKG